MVYADYAYYTGTYHGDIVPDTAWDKAAIKATRWLDWYTGDRILLPPTENVTLACCAVAEVFYEDDERGHDIESETTGKYKVQYSGDILQVRLERAVRMYLDCSLIGRVVE